ncbi:putative transcription regulator SAP family [Helianthus anomalus]
MMAHTQVFESDSETETYDSDDSQQDPSFHILEETRSKFSDLSIKKKPSSRVPMELDEEDDCTEITVPKLDANEEKSFEIVQKIIEDCQVEKLKVEQCKLYLRRHGLRLTGKKDILIERIKEHISIINGEGEHKYPASTFVMNCKGDACTGDIVMFEQNVYEMFNIASRSASGPPCGQRIVAGRIVKESYGAAKQQHTFTIEVLWSKGTKPLPPLHPLLIKGRNLYRLKTMRQRWEDESERQKILSEKHARGNAARTNRDARLHEKEMRKTLRASKGNIKNEKQKDKRATPPIISSRTSIPHSNAPVMVSRDHGASYKENMIPNTFSRGPGGPLRKSSQVEQNMMNEKQENKRNASPTCHPRVPSVQHAGAPFMGVLGNRGMDHGAPYRENMNPRDVDGPLRWVEQNMGFYPSRTFQRHDYDLQNLPKSYTFQQQVSNKPRGHFHYEGKRQQLCRFYPIGRCHYGTNCKYLH